jgi:hypothetical protein
LSVVVESLSGSWLLSLFLILYNKNTTFSLNFNHFSNHFSNFTAFSFLWVKITKKIQNTKNTCYFCLFFCYIFIFFAFYFLICVGGTVVPVVTAAPPLLTFITRLRYSFL